MVIRCSDPACEGFARVFFLIERAERDALRSLTPESGVQPQLALFHTHRHGAEDSLGIPPSAAQLRRRLAVAYVDIGIGDDAIVINFSERGVPQDYSLPGAIEQCRCQRMPNRWRIPVYVQGMVGQHFVFTLDPADRLTRGRAPLNLEAILCIEDNRIQGINIEDYVRLYARSLRSLAPPRHPAPLRSLTLAPK